MPATKIVLDTTDYKKSVTKFKSRIKGNLRTSMLEAMRLVATTSVNDFMKPHMLKTGEHGIPGGTKVISGRKGGAKLGILTSRLMRSILDQESEFGREGIRRVSIRSNVVVGEIGSKVPYARIHEKGGTINHNNLFGRGISATINIPARPYLQPAVEKSQAGITEIFRERMNILIERI